jgi:uncharacterized protein YbjT (DUF2867 family)
MRVLVVGGTGLIGSALVARLADDGHECITVSRAQASRKQGRHVRLDVAQTASPEEWFIPLAGIDAVVNAAGALQDASMQGVHVAGVAALYAACEARGVRRVIHLSAIGADRETPSTFSRTKRDGENVLMACDLDWVVLRPSIVIGRAAYGGSALLRGLAALPVIPVLPDTAPIQPVELDDVIETIVFFLKPNSPTRQTLDLAGPRRMAFHEAVMIFRRWLRWPQAASLAVPGFAAKILFRLGDLAHGLGWRTPITSTAQAEMRRGATGDAETWQRVTGLKARDVETILHREPASVQERWFARLYALKPLVFGVFGLFWIITALISLGPGWDMGVNLLLEGGLAPQMAAVTVALGALADLTIGAAILIRPLSRYGLWAALIISLVYIALGSALAPRLWSDPLGPMLKIWPVLILNLVAMAIREDR